MVQTSALRREGGMSDLEQARALHRKNLRSKRSSNMANGKELNNDKALEEVDRILSRVTASASSIRREFMRSDTHRRFAGTQGAFHGNLHVDDLEEDQDALQKLLMEDVVNGCDNGDSAATFSSSSTSGLRNNRSRLANAGLSTATQMEKEWRDEVRRLNMNDRSDALRPDEHQPDDDMNLQMAIQNSVMDIDTEYEKALAASMVGNLSDSTSFPVSPKTLDEAMALSIRELKALALSAGLDIGHCCEKKELANLVLGYIPADILSENTLYSAEHCSSNDEELMSRALYLSMQDQGTSNK